jgi:predicted peptidase
VRKSQKRRANAWVVLIACFLFVILSTTQLLALSGSVQTITFTGPVTGHPVTFSLYLPSGYNSSTNRYPVIIHLHGIGGTHNGAQISLVPESHEAAVIAGLIEPCIIVFPDGYNDSFWADSVNSTKPAETNVKEEIIPYLDANYRTIASRSRRVIQGFSMGGFGAAKFATKFPDTFCACVVYDGAMLTWEQVQQRHPVQTSEIFNNSGATFDLYSPWYWLGQNANALRTAMPFRDIAAALINENRAWRDALLAQSINSNYVETGLPHSIGPLLDAQGAASWSFISTAFAQASTNNSNGLQHFVQKQGTNVSVRWPSQTDEQFHIERRANLQPTNAWQALATNWPAGVGVETEFVHSNALSSLSGYYRVMRQGTSAPPAFTFDWTGTNFTYTDAQRTFTGIMLKPTGSGPFPAVIISHGAGGTATGYSLSKAREMVAWGLVCIGPTLTHVAGGETNSPNMGNCPENIARAAVCANVLAGLSYVDTNRIALFGHSMGAFATIGDAAALGGRIRAAAITAGGVIPDSAGANNAAPTVTEANPVHIPFLMFHCDGDPVVPAVRSQLFQQLLNTNAVVNQRIIYSTNSIPNQSNWHNIHQDLAINTNVLTNTFQWFKTHGVLP